MNYENGKKLVLLGFGMNLFVNVLFILNLFILNSFNAILGCCQYLSIGIAALGFLLMWMVNRDVVDFLSCGATGVATLLGLLQSIGIITVYSQAGNIVVSGLVSAFYVALALRAVKSNMFITLLLICAFIYQVFSGSFFINFLYAKIGIPYLPVFAMWFVGYAVCAGICFLEVKIEN